MFNKDKEPESQEFELYRDKIQYNEDHPDGKLHVVYTTETSDRYYDAKYNVLKNMEGFKANIPSPDDQKLHVKFRDAIEWQEL